MTADCFDFEYWIHLNPSGISRRGNWQGWVQIIGYKEILPSRVHDVPGDRTASHGLSGRWAHPILREAVKGTEMSESKALVCGLYRNEATVEYALCHLRNVGFLDQNFSVIFPATGPDDIELGKNGPLGKMGSTPDICRTVWTQEILLSVQCESAGQAVIARKILQCTDADTVVSSTEEPANIEFRTEKFSHLA
jgi:hypothetical protein